MASAVRATAAKCRSWNDDFTRLWEAEAIATFKDNRAKIGTPFAALSLPVVFESSGTDDKASSLIGQGYKRLNRLAQAHVVGEKASLINAESQPFHTFDLEGIEPSLLRVIHHFADSDPCRGSE